MGHFFDPEVCPSNKYIRCSNGHGSESECAPYLASDPDTGGYDDSRDVERGHPIMVTKLAVKTGDPYAW